MRFAISRGDFGIFIFYNTLIDVKIRLFPDSIASLARVSASLWTWGRDDDDCRQDFDDAG